eukprot:TRINITY_DN24265_c0_g1_i1.p1 TRINITY_DN24265_c0_g1~~TRINITY_DN24265_c0_g1_i1.p1  ORF type:complete len:791 (+),score=77.23 TRINITY_DN24265_c0_g1_i1:76-2448(+)
MECSAVTATNVKLRLPSAPPGSQSRPSFSRKAKVAGHGRRKAEPDAQATSSDVADSSSSTDCSRYRRSAIATSSPRFANIDDTALVQEMIRRMPTLSVHLRNRLKSSVCSAEGTGNEISSTCPSFSTNVTNATFSEFSEIGGVISDSSASVSSHLGEILLEPRAIESRRIMPSLEQQCPASALLKPRVQTPRLSGAMFSSTPAVLERMPAARRSNRAKTYHVARVNDDCAAESSAVDPPQRRSLNNGDLDTRGIDFYTIQVVETDKQTHANMNITTSPREKSVVTYNAQKVASKCSPVSKDVDTFSARRPCETSTGAPPCASRQALNPRLPDRIFASSPARSVRRQSESFVDDTKCTSSRPSQHHAKPSLGSSSPAEQPIAFNKNDDDLSKRSSASHFVSEGYGYPTQTQTPRSAWNSDIVQGMSAITITPPPQAPPPLTLSPCPPSATPPSTSHMQSFFPQPARITPVTACKLSPPPPVTPRPEVPVHRAGRLPVGKFTSMPSTLKPASSSPGTSSPKASKMQASMVAPLSAPPCAAIMEEESEEEESTRLVSRVFASVPATSHSRLLHALYESNTPDSPSFSKMLEQQKNKNEAGSWHTTGAGSLEPGQHAQNSCHKSKNLSASIGTVRLDEDRSRSQGNAETAGKSKLIDAILQDEDSSDEEITELLFNAMGVAKSGRALGISDAGMLKAGIENLKRDNELLRRASEDRRSSNASQSTDAAFTSPANPCDDIEGEQASPNAEELSETDRWAKFRARKEAKKAKKANPGADAKITYGMLLERGGMQVK